ncbi:RICIN domain-containing protein [Streptomyces microflavus]|uniref:RICIN domain-containing protein n=1 Tax=Streptomyces microflavus TaxID=1919 RepID=UPI0038284D75
MGKGNGYVSLKAKHSGKCLDVSGNSTANGARLFQYACGSGTNQQFKCPAA